MPSASVDGLDQRVHVRPTIPVERNINRFRFVSQYETQKAA